MSWTQADLDELKRAYALGAKEVAFADGRKVIYRSIGEMQTVLKTVEAEVFGRPRTLADDRVASGYDSNLSRGAPAYFGGFRR